MKNPILTIEDMLREEYKDFIKFFNDRNYFHGGKKSSYTDYSWVGVRGAIETYANTALSFFPDLPKSAKVLDVGSGKSYLVKRLLDLNYDAYGFDCSEYAIQDGLAEFPELQGRSFVGDITDDVFVQSFIKAHGKADLTNASEILEHVPEEFTKQALKNIFALSKKYILLSMPFDDEPDQLEVETHVNVRDRAYWEKLIEPYAHYVVGGNVRLICWNLFALELNPKEAVKEIKEPVKEVRRNEPVKGNMKQPQTTQNAK